MEAKDSVKADIDIFKTIDEIFKMTDYVVFNSSNSLEEKLALIELWVKIAKELLVKHGLY